MEIGKTQADCFVVLQPFLGSGEASNRIVGKIKLGGETLSTIDGHWDQEITLKDKRTGVCRMIDD